MDSSFAALAVTALVAGTAFGYCAQRGGFCLVRALSNAVLTGDTAIARAYALALVVAIVGLHLLITVGAHLPMFAFTEDIQLRPFPWVADLVGGFLFGVGMILAGGCAGSTWYRIGEGSVGAGIVLLGFALGATTAGVGALSPARQALQQYTVSFGDAPVTLYQLVGLGPWPVVAVIVIAAGIWLARGFAEPEHGKWRWPVTGVAMGLVTVLGWYLSSFGRTPVGITFAENTGHLLTYPLVWFPSRVSWSMVMVLGVPVGAAVAAWRHDQLAWKLPAAPTIVRLFGAGLVMGIGAIVAQGCNITQGLTNAATLALGSLAAFAAMLAGGWATLWLLYLRKSPG